MKIQKQRCVNDILNILRVIQKTEKYVNILFVSFVS